MYNNPSSFDVTIRSGRVVTGGAVRETDVGISGGIITSIGNNLPPGTKDFDARGKWVLPGGIDSHCHVEQLSGMGVMSADDFYSATVSAAFGGTTTIIPFAAQHRGLDLPGVLADYSARAAAKAVIDYGIHVILANPDERTMKVDLPEAIRSGVTSLKIYLTYDKLKLDDYQVLDVLALAIKEKALVMVHAENHDMIKWLSTRLLENGHKAPKFHGVAHDPIAEAEATNRAISLARLLDTRLLIVHVAGKETIDVIRSAQTLGVEVMAESCPQYLFLTAEDLDRNGLEGAKYCCSPPPRDAESQEAVWAGFRDGTVATYSSDHAPYRFDASGKLPKGDATTFKDMANGVPGIELRLPLLFSEGFLKGRLDIHEFVALTAGNHAKLYGLAPRKGAIAVSADADIAIWNPAVEKTITASMLHDQVGYTPYEGKKITGWPEVVLSRGRSVVEHGELLAARGSGKYISRGAPGSFRPPTTAPRRGAGHTLRALIGLDDGR